MRTIHFYKPSLKTHLCTHTMLPWVIGSEKLFQRWNKYYIVIKRQRCSFKINYIQNDFSNIVFQTSWHWILLKLKNINDAD